MRSIEERADEYIGHSSDYDENVTISMSRCGFRAGAKSEHDELTKWHSDDEIPEKEKWILMKVKDYDGLIFYVSVKCYGGEFLLQKELGRTILGWRYIVDED